MPFKQFLSETQTRPAPPHKKKHKQIDSKILFKFKITLCSETASHSSWAFSHPHCEVVSEVDWLVLVLLMISHSLGCSHGWLLS